MLRLLEKFLCQPSSKWVTFSNQGKNKAAKGAELALPFFGCAHDTVGLTPLPQRLLGYGKPLP